MPINSKYKAKYSFGNFYHVYNRTSAKQAMFISPENNIFFLEKFNQYLGSYVDILSSCLIPNHFHFLIKIKEEDELRKLPPEKELHSVITRQFKNFFICYSMSFKKRYALSGNVFAQKYKHIRLYTDKDILRTILYIHRNPEHHHVGDWQSYRWSSYAQLLMSSENEPKVRFVMELFGGKLAFKKAHLEYIRQGSEPL